MSPSFRNSTRRGFLRDVGVAGAAASTVPLLRPLGARADTPSAEGLRCPHPNPIVHENRCTDPATFSADFRLSTTYTEITGYARAASVDVGEPVELVIAGPNLFLPPSPQEPVETVEVEVYRLGYYDGKGGRLVWRTPGPVSTFQKLDPDGQPVNGGTLPPDHPTDAGTGLRGRARDRTVVTVPGSVLGTSGVYLAKLKGRWIEFPPGTSAVMRSGESHVVFVVRDDARPRGLLALLPSNTWQAYNYANGRSLYTFSSRFGSAGSIVPATGTERAAKVSLDRPYNNWIAEYNWVLRTEFPAIWWLERHGYDVSYTEDVALSFAPEQAQPTSSAGVAILGHGEYWSQELRDGLEQGRDAGTSIFNFGANAGFWKVRHETADGVPARNAEEARVLVCYKTIEGGGSSDPATASLSDPVSPTSTWRDPGRGPGVGPGTQSATPPVYEGPNRPEAELLGGQYIGNDDVLSRDITVPADNGAGEFAGHRAWRWTTMPREGATVGRGLLGWEWDAIPPPTARFGGRPPATLPGEGALLRMSATDPRVAAPRGATTQYLLDAGRSYTPPEPAPPAPAGESAVAHASTYRSPSGALVFNAGTILWAWGLGPHFLDASGGTYSDQPTDRTDARIIQATTNLLADAGILPITPEGLRFDPPPSDGGGPPDGPVSVPTAAAVAAQPIAPSASAPNATPLAASAPPALPALPALAFVRVRRRPTKKGRVQARVEARRAVPRVVRGTVELTIARKRVARASFVIAKGARRSATVELKLSRATRLLLDRKGSLRPLVRIQATDSGRAVKVLSRTSILARKRR